MPLIASDLGVHPVDLFAAASDHAIKANIVLKGIGANDVVVVGIGNSDCNAARLVYATCNRFELQGDVDVLRHYGIKDSKRKTIVRAVGAGLFDDPALKRSLITYYGPLTRLTLTGPPKFEIGGRRPDVHFSDGNNRRGGLREGFRSTKRDSRRDNCRGDQKNYQSCLCLLVSVHAQSSPQSGVAQSLDGISV